MLKIIPCTNEVHPKDRSGLNPTLFFDYSTKVGRYRPHESRMKTTKQCTHKNKHVNTDEVCTYGKHLYYTENFANIKTCQDLTQRDFWNYVKKIIFDSADPTKMNVHIICTHAERLKRTIMPTITRGVLPGEMLCIHPKTSMHVVGNPGLGYKYQNTVKLERGDVELVDPGRQDWVFLVCTGTVIDRSVDPPLTQDGIKSAVRNAKHIKQILTDNEPRTDIEYHFAASYLFGAQHTALLIERKLLGEEMIHKELHDRFLNISTNRTNGKI